MKSVPGVAVCFNSKMEGLQSPVLSAEQYQFHHSRRLDTHLAPKRDTSSAARHPLRTRVFSASNKARLYVRSFPSLIPFNIRASSVVCVFCCTDLRPCVSVVELY
eukprot:GEMP01148919.1.p1 GENE.GEMP01148919.1~~GEMP01148919.1.p1  ORF type:complete len:121 (+),score=6.21 GEMP01148919.1:51-365(+)